MMSISLTLEATKNKLNTDLSLSGQMFLLYCTKSNRHTWFTQITSATYS